MAPRAQVLERGSEVGGDRFDQKRGNFFSFSAGVERLLGHLTTWQKGNWITRRVLAEVGQAQWRARQTEMSDSRPRFHSDTWDRLQ